MSVHARVSLNPALPCCSAKMLAVFFHEMCMPMLCNISALTCPLQIIARIHTNQPRVRRLIHALLVRVGRHHPQALMYPLLVAVSSSSPNRRAAATAVVDAVRQHSATLVEQAELVRAAFNIKCQGVRMRHVACNEQRCTGSVAPWRCYLGCWASASMLCAVS